MQELNIQTLVKDNKNNWKLKLLAGANGLDNIITVSEINRPGLALTGYFGYFAYERVQVFGKTELSYLSKLPKNKLKAIFGKLFSYKIPCVVITTKLKPPQELINHANAKHIPVLGTSIITTRFNSELTNYLEEKFAASMTIHGVLVDVFGVGILILGKSGIGKSECALELIHRNHRLVADDVVFIKKTPEKTLFGTKDASLGYLLEIRGLGIIDIRELFGVTAIRDTKKIELVAILEEWKSSKEYERIGLDENYFVILNAPLPKIVLPVKPGRNVAMLLEVAAVNIRAKKMGLNSVEEFDKRMLHKIKKGI